MKKLSGMDMLKKAFQPKKKKFWISKAIKKPGALHSELGISQGKKIPAKTLASAAQKGGKIGKRARLAQTLKGFHSKKRKIGIADDFGVNKVKEPDQKLMSYKRAKKSKKKVKNCSK